MKPFLPSFKRALDCSLPSFKRALDCSLPSCHVRDKQSTAEMHVRTASQHGRSGGTGLLPDLAAAPLGQERPVPPALPCWIAYLYGTSGEAARAVDASGPAPTPRAGLPFPHAKRIFGLIPSREGGVRNDCWCFYLSRYKEHEKGGWFVMLIQTSSAR